MSFSKLTSMQLYACEPCIVDIEVDISNGLNAFSIVGLPDKATEEAKDRISAAIKNSGFTSPKSKNHKVVISLAPAELRKEGSNFDLGMALAYLLSTGEICFDPKDKLFLGELSLDGTLRPIKGALPLVMGSKKKGIKEIYLPFENREEASLVGGIKIFPVSHLRNVIAHLDQKNKNAGPALSPVQPKPFQSKKRIIELDFNEIKGQEGVKRALEIAAAGNHNIMMHGPPGVGKTMLARAFAYLLPELTFDEMLEVTTIHSTVKHLNGIFDYPPFRTPHHSTSFTSVVGGGNFPKPGEVSLAHRGVLFMDEFPEFDLRVINSLRQPIEDKKVTISRAKTSITFPSDFILVASMNPCPCGFRGSLTKDCICTAQSIKRYQRKISGPIVDRIDIWIEVSGVDYKKLGGNNNSESTQEIAKRVARARAIRHKRGGVVPTLAASCRMLMDTSAEVLRLSARGYHKVLLISRTIADLEGKEYIEESHILEAMQYRPKLF